MITTINKKAWKPLADDIRPSFPLDTLPEACAELADNIATSLPVPPDYAACAILGAASCALVGRVKVEIKPHYQEPAQLYLGILSKGGDYVLESSAREAVRKQAWMKKARDPQAEFAGA